MTLEITDQNYKELIINQNKPVMLDFGASWCNPCKTIEPLIEEISQKYGDRAIIRKIDVDNCPEISVEYGIRNIPTVLYIKDGKIVDKQVGAAPKSVLEDKLKKLL